MFVFFKCSRISHCYLVFDILNSTDFEMELKYHENKSILIEPRETCRIPVPVERCPLMPEDVEVLNNRLLNLNAILARCKSHLVNQVNLNWSLISFSRDLISCFPKFSIIP